MMIYGYKRPIIGDESGEQQLVDRQVDQLFVEAHPFSKKRHVLEDLLMTIQPGDEIVVENLVVLADSFHQLLDVLHVLAKDRVRITFLEEQISNTSLLQLDLLESVTLFTNLQTQLKSHATTFGLVEAKKAGKTIGRPKKSDDNLRKAFAMYQSKNYSLMDIKNETGISKSTLYRYIDEVNKGHHDN
ncbi:recombinase family protein [Lysinibacillus irui]|uniref:Recombinase family protein n=2 Tax=Lysinibacillus irui TaxID=2998077 RepID=A0AAJ5RP94_9BACI|nr:recombinase family protein [Lysinibacillus irui]WDV08888.1 recombinase family protein [Lysinibacillus irui]